METVSITKAEYIGNLAIKVWFDDNTVQTIDVGAFLKKHSHRQYNKYTNEKHFKNFKLENGNIVWGKNWDLVFPIEQLHNGAVSA